VDEFTARLAQTDVHRYSKEYSYPWPDLGAQEAGKLARQAGHYDLAGFLEVARWKSPRVYSLCAENPKDFVADVTRVALAARGERLRIEALTLLRGVDWPMASTLLHFARPEAYPILDFRALWSIGMPATHQYDFAFWWEYTLRCRALARMWAVDLRTLDKALWQFSKARQLPARGGQDEVA
jgi:hypothetical protein